VAALYPNLKLIASTLRTASTASRNAWGAIALYEDKIVHVPQREIDIFDRVGGGDSFASGLIYGLLAGKPIDWALRCGVAHGALAMTTPGDTSTATLAEVDQGRIGEDRAIARSEKWIGEIRCTKARHRFSNASASSLYFARATQSRPTPWCRPCLPEASPWLKSP
jgi:bifunctional ADP-heptose synthase (sugar kinase/adenylyltransferase)